MLCVLTRMKGHGPYILSALSQYKRKVDALGHWSEAHFDEWNVLTVTVNAEYEHYCGSMGFGLLSVGVTENQILSSVQKECCFGIGS